MIDYSGKIVNIGLDVHKKTYALVAICDGVVIKKATIKSSYNSLLDFITKYFPNATKINTAYEAGFSGFGLHRFLTENNIINIVIHAASIEVSSRDRVKTDKRDALKIATQLAARRLKCIHIPSKEQEHKRSITRIRETLATDRNRIVCRIKHFLHLNELPPIWDGEQKITATWVNRALNYDMGSYELNYVFKLLLKQWQELTEKITNLNKELQIQADKDSKEQIYRSVPGIGKIAARILSNELGNMTQFENEKNLFSYTGLTPCEYSSGDHIRQGHISRQGKPIIRKILVLAAWVAIRKDRSLAEIFKRISVSAGAKRAIVAVARRLIGRIRACLQTGALYSVPVVKIT